MTNTTIKKYSVTAPDVKLVELEFVYSQPGPRVTGAAFAAQILTQQLASRPNERFVALYLNARNEITHYQVVSVGTLTSVLVHPREVYQAAILTNSASIICGHNHPSGDVSPSPEDREAFETLRAASDILDIKLVDFLIVSPTGEYYSFCENEIGRTTVTS